MNVFIDLLISSFPILLLIGVWIYFMRRNSGSFESQRLMPGYMQQDLELKTRIAEALEKLADKKTP